MQPSPELRRDWEFYPGRKKGKIQVMLNPDQLNIALIRIQDKYVGPIAISVTLNIPHCLSSRSKLQHILFKVHQGPFLEGRQGEQAPRRRRKAYTRRRGKSLTLAGIKEE